MGSKNEDWLKDILAAEQSKSESENSGVRVSGKQKAAALLGKLDADTRNRILGGAGEKSVFTNQMKELMFTFDDMPRIDIRHMPLVLQNIDPSDLTLALKKCRIASKNWIFKSISTRMSERIQDDLEALGPVPVTKVEEAQQKIAKTVIRLQEAGKISIEGYGGEAYV
ncbi:MAG: hypothetical protein HQM14_11615 [SAR324 cluster bacterium]|nr:hypothetical protein [SAR324 cluster bacterium]